MHRIMQTTRITKALLFMFSAAPAWAQYIPPSPSGPVPGAIDSWLAASAPALNGMDVGLNGRLRYEDKEGAGTTHAGTNFDFASAPPTRNTNEYWISRLMPRFGYTGDWISAALELRSSYSFGDDRYTAAAPGKNLPEDDGPLQLELAFVTIGNFKDFPLTVKIGRQELILGDQRLVGSAMWLNIPHTFDAV
jgi:hypothetical protein